MSCIVTENVEPQLKGELLLALLRLVRPSEKLCRLSEVHARLHDSRLQTLLDTCLRVLDAFVAGSGSKSGQR